MPTDRTPWPQAIANMAMPLMLVAYVLVFLFFIFDRDFSATAPSGAAVGVAECRPTTPTGGVDAKQLRCAGEPGSAHLRSAQ